MGNDKFLVIARGSPRDPNVFEPGKKAPATEDATYPELDGKTIIEYAKDHGVGVYQDPDNDGRPLTLSCHKTNKWLMDGSDRLKVMARDNSGMTEEEIALAKEVRDMATEGGHVGVVMYGGMSLQAPSQVSARAEVAQVWGVPTGGRHFAGIGSELSLFDLPPDTALGWVGRNQVGKGVKLAVDAMSYDGGVIPVTFSGDASGRLYDGVAAKLSGLGIDMGTTVDENGIVVTVGDFSEIDYDVNGVVRIHVVPATPGDENMATLRGLPVLLEASQRLNGTIIQGEKNAALLAGQIVGGYDRGVQDKVRGYFAGVREGKPDDPKTQYTKTDMTIDHFMFGGEE